jgi:hypothetical protein
MQKCTLVGKDQSLKKAMWDQWHNSLPDHPDYSVYAHPDYYIEIWDCWTAWSRPYILALEKGGVFSFLKDRGVRSTADLGCGGGLTTACLMQMLGGNIVGTNYPSGPQYQVCCKLALQYGFSVKEKLDHAVDLVFASEYFEHFQNPVDHLLEVLAVAKPSVLIIANTFTSAAIGHFPTYNVGGQIVSGKQASAAFNKTLKASGYSQQSFNLWNSRPTIWVKD